MIASGESRCRLDHRVLPLVSASEHPQGSECLTKEESTWDESWSPLAWEEGEAPCPCRGQGQCGGWAPPWGQVSGLDVVAATGGPSGLRRATDTAGP